MGKKRKTSMRPRTNKWLRVVKKPWFRPLVAVLVILVAGGGVLLTNNLHHSPYDGARSAADDFFRAYADCDLKTVQKYYLKYAYPDSADVKSFVNDCKKGTSSFTYVKQLDASTKHIGKDTGWNVALVYDYHDSQSNHSGQLMIYLVGATDLDDWQIFSITPYYSDSNSHATNSGATYNSLHL